MRSFRLKEEESLSVALRQHPPRAALYRRLHTTFQKRKALHIKLEGSSSHT